MAYAYSEGAVTRLRREFKLLLPKEEAEALVARLRGETAPCTTQITSVYFDRPGLPLTTRAHSTPEDCLKIRTKEYFPDLGGGARVVVEAKRERNGLTQKQRAWVDRSELQALYESGELWGRVPLSDPGALAPVLAVSYLRDVYQRSETWRVTVDRDVSFHPIEVALALGSTRLEGTVLPAPFSREQGVVLEVKHLGHELPQWLAELRAKRATKYSKFAEGMARRNAPPTGEVGRS